VGQLQVSEGLSQGRAVGIGVIEVEIDDGSGNGTQACVRDAESMLRRNVDKIMLNLSEMRSA